MDSLPLKRGSTRSNHDDGLGNPDFAASAALKQTAVIQAFMPTQAGGFAA